MGVCHVFSIKLDLKDFLIIFVYLKISYVETFLCTITYTVDKQHLI